MSHSSMHATMTARPLAWRRLKRSCWFAAPRSSKGSPMSHTNDSKPIAPEELHALIVVAQAGALAASQLAENGTGIRNEPAHVCSILRRVERDGIAARNRVIMANMRLVTKIAAPMAKAAGVLHELDDLTQAGVIGARGTGGLMRAIEKFDTTR